MLLMKMEVMWIRGKPHDWAESDLTDGFNPFSLIKSAQVQWNLFASDVNKVRRIANRIIEYAYDMSFIL